MKPRKTIPRLFLEYSPFTKKKPSKEQVPVSWKDIDWHLTKRDDNWDTTWATYAGTYPVTYSYVRTNR